MTAQAMNIVTPITLNDGNTTSNIPVPDTADPALWTTGSYNPLDRVTHQVGSTYLIYECAVAISGNKEPQDYPVEWIYVSPANRARMFDTTNFTSSEYSTVIDVTVTPGTVVNTLALFNCDTQSIIVTMVDPTAGTVFGPETYQMQAPSKGGWYSYLFDGITTKRDLIVDLPSYKSATVQVEINNSGTATCGTMLLGKGVGIGTGVHYGARLGITDYSRKERDTFGEYNFVVRSYSKRGEFTMFIPNERVDIVHQLLSDLRALPTLYVATSEYTSSAIFGYYKDFDITLQYTDHAVCTISLEGLS